MNHSNYTYDLISKDIFKTFPFSKSTWETKKTKPPTYILYKIKTTSEKSLVEQFAIKNFKNSLSRKTDFFEIIEFSEDYQRSQRDYWMDWISKWLTNDPKIPAGEFGAQEGKKDEQTLINEYLKETEKLPEDERRAKIIATYLND